MSMFNAPLDSQPAKLEQAEQAKNTSAGRSLKKIFHQDDSLKKIEAQPATFSLLMNPIRFSVYLHLFNKPCDHTRSIARSVGFSTTAINWHLGQLSEKGYIESVDTKGKKLYWPSGMMFKIDIPTVEALRQPYAIPILKVISKNGEPVSQKHIVAGLKEVQQNVDVWLVHLLSAGLLERTGKRKEARFSIASNLSERISHYDSEARKCSNKVISILRADGLMPVNPRLRRSRLCVYVKLPRETRKLNLECNPLAPARRYCTKPE